MKVNEELGQLQQSVLEKLAELSPQANKLLLAVSGGGDSIALLRLLAASKYDINVAHVDHALRENSSEDAAFVKDLCEHLRVPFYAARFDLLQIARAKGKNLEDTARQVRYSFFTKIAQKINADAIVTAHNLDDQAETVLMQLLRGAAFLRGMKACKGCLLRPLLNVPKQDLLNYLKVIDQDYRTDQTNFDTTYTRAWLRHKVLPKLKVRYPNIKITLARLADLQQAQAEHFDKLIKPLSSKKLEIGRIQQTDVALQRHAIANIIKLAGIGSDFEHIEMIRRSLNQKHPTQVSLPREKVARIRYGSLDIVNVLPEALDHNTQQLKMNISDLEGEIEVEKLADFQNLKFRYRQAGDKIKLVGGTKKLSDLFIDRKISRETRNKVLLLASESQVLWVKGVVIDARVARTKQDDDVQWMKIAFQEAKDAGDCGELPVGTAIIKDGELIAKAGNATERSNDPTAHAEVIALRDAARLLQSWRLEGCTLYTTLEPCPMCFGAILQAHLPRVVYGASNLREGAFGGVSDLQKLRWKRRIEVRSGVMAKASRELLRDFFTELR